MAPPIPKSCAWARDAEPIGNHEVGLVGAIRFASGQLLLAGIAFFIAFIGFFVPAKEGPIVGLSIGVGCSLTGVGLLVWGFMRSGGVIKHVRVFDAGVMWLEGDRWQGAQWHEIAEVYRVDVRVNGGITAKHVTIKTTSRKEADFHYTLSRWDKLADTIQIATTNVLVPQLREEYEAGDKVKFGPAMAISQDGLTMDKQRVAFEDMEKIELRNGSVVVYSGGRKGNCHAVGFGQIANAMAFLKLLEESPAPPVEVVRR